MNQKELKYIDKNINLNSEYFNKLKSKLTTCENKDDILIAVSTIYGTTESEDNAYKCRGVAVQYVITYMGENKIKAEPGSFMNHLYSILEKNIVCTDPDKWDYDKWCLIKTEDN